MSKHILSYLTCAFAGVAILTYLIGKILWFSAFTENMLFFSVCGFLAALGAIVALYVGKRISRKASDKPAENSVLARCAALSFCFWVCVCVLLSFIWPDNKYIETAAALFLSLALVSGLCSGFMSIAKKRL